MERVADSKAQKEKSNFLFDEELNYFELKWTDVFDDTEENLAHFEEMADEVIQFLGSTKEWY